MPVAAAAWLKLVEQAFLRACQELAPLTAGQGQEHAWREGAAEHDLLAHHGDLDAGRAVAWPAPMPSQFARWLKAHCAPNRMPRSQSNVTRLT